MKEIPFSSCRGKEHSSSKTCCCGGHNASNPKSNKKHNSTKKKLFIKVQRKFKKLINAVIV